MRLQSLLGWIQGCIIQVIFMMMITLMVPAMITMNQISPSFLESNTNVSQQSLLWLAMSSLGSKIDLINHHFSSCSKCKGNADDTCDFLADSGASLNFTNNLNDFSEYNEIKDGPSI